MKITQKLGFFVATLWFLLWLMVTLMTKRDNYEGFWEYAGIALLGAIIIFLMFWWFSKEPNASDNHKEEIREKKYRGSARRYIIALGITWVLGFGYLAYLDLDIAETGYSDPLARTLSVAGYGLIIIIILFFVLSWVFKAPSKKSSSKVIL